LGPQQTAPFLFLRGLLGPTFSVRTRVVSPQDVLLPAPSFLTLSRGAISHARLSLNVCRPALSPLLLSLGAFVFAPPQAPFSALGGHQFSRASPSHPRGVSPTTRRLVGAPLFCLKTAPTTIGARGAAYFSPLSQSARFYALWGGFRLCLAPPGRFFPPLSRERAFTTLAVR